METKRADSSAARADKPARGTARRVFGYVAPLLRPERAEYLIILACGCLFSLLDVAFAMLMRALINCAQAGQAQGMLRAVCGMLAVCALRVLGGKTLALRDGRMQERLGMRARARLLERIQRKRCADVMRFHSGEVMNRLYGDLDTVLSAVLDLVPELAMMAFGLLGAAAALYVISPWLPLALCAAGLCFFLCMRLFKGVIGRLHKDMRAADDRAYAFYQETLSHPLVIRAFRAAGRVEAGAQAREQTLYVKWKRWQGMSLLSSAAADGFKQFGYFGVVVACAWRLLAGAMPFGDMAAVVQLAGKIQDPFAGLSGMIPRLSAAGSSLDRLEEIENLPDEAQAAPVDARFDALMLQNVTFAYENGTNVLENADFTLKRGEFALLTGDSGAGKTTLIHLLTSVLTPLGGRAFARGAGGDTPLSAATRALFAYVPQGSLLFSGTLRENLTLLCGEKPEKEMYAALRTACAEDFARALPGGLDTALGEDGRGLSAGQAQRISLARAILSQAPVLVLDEATSALDAQTEEAVLRNLRALKDKTILLVSHRPAALNVCDTRLTLSGGKIRGETLDNEWTRKKAT